MCQCNKTQIELMNGKPLGSSICVCRECWECRKYCARCPEYEGDDEKTEGNPLRKSHYVYFSNEMKILKGDDNVRFSVFTSKEAKKQKVKPQNDYIRMYADCCKTIMLGYSKDFQGFAGKRVAYLVTDPKLFKGKAELPKPKALLFKTDMSDNKELTALRKSLDLTQKEIFNVGSIKSGKRKAAADMGRAQLAIGIRNADGKNIDPAPGKKGLSFLDLMKAQMTQFAEEEPDEWNNRPSSPRKTGLNRFS